MQGANLVIRSIVKAHLKQSISSILYAQSLTHPLTTHTSGTAIGSSFYFSILPTTLELVDDPLYPLSHSRPVQESMKHITMF